MSQHPELAPYRANLGTASGFDIVSDKEGGVAAEVFAAVRPSNNQKLDKDIRRRLPECDAKLRYVFFMCPGYSKGRQEKLETVSGVEVWSVGDSL